MTRKDKGMQRQNKYFFKNEREVLLDLGLTPAPGSGSGWVSKEDGENDYVLAQLKSTDKQSYSIKQLDLEKLEYNANVAGKVPIFIIQFLNMNKRYALVEIEDLPDAAEYLQTGTLVSPPKVPEVILNEEKDLRTRAPERVIKSSASARNQFNQDQEDYWENRKFNK